MQHRINRGIIGPDHTSKPRPKELNFPVVYKRPIGAIQRASPTAYNHHIVLVALDNIVRNIVPYKTLLLPDWLVALERHYLLADRVAVVAKFRYQMAHPSVST